MSKDIPEIDDLTRGINDSELILTQDSVETQVEHKEKNNQAQEKNTAVSLSDTGCWDEFMEFLQSDGSGTDKTERLVCKLDRDLADSLDHGRCRSDLVNAIVRAFFKSYLPRLAEYRREKKSLFNSYNL